MTDVVNLLWVEVSEEGQSEGGAADGFGDGQGVGGGKVAVGGLGVDGGEVTAALDALRGEVVCDSVAGRFVEVRCEADDVDEPADAGVGDG